MNTFSNFSNDATTYIAAKTLDRIHRDTVVYGLGKKEKLPNRFSKTFQYTRYEKINLPKQALTEGTTPTTSSLSMSTVTCIMDQWGDFVTLTDVAQVTIKHPVIQEAIPILAEQAAETIDREVIKVLMANTNIYYPGTATSRVTIGATDYVDSAVLRKVIAGLRNGGARGYEGRMFVGLFDHSVEQDLNQDTTFVQAASYSNIMPLLNAEVGKWLGVRWVCSNLLPTLTLLADPVTAATTGGSLANSTPYYFKLTAVDNALGFEQKVTAEFTESTGVADTRINITMPADTDYTYNLYAGSATGVHYLHSSNNVAAAVVAVDAIPIT